MKKFILSLCFFSLLLCSTGQAKAVGAGYRYIDGAGFYSDVVLPLDVAKSVNLEEPDNDFVPVANKEVNLSKLKKGTSTRTNVLGLVEWGDAGIYKAAKDGKIKKIYYVEVNREKLYVPVGFIPVYFNRFITTVYGE